MIETDISPIFNMSNDCFPVQGFINNSYKKESGVDTLMIKSVFTSVNTQIGGGHRDPFFII